MRRTTIDGAVGSTRGPNIYCLLVSPEEWEKHAEAVVSKRAEESRRRRSAAQRLARARESTVRGPFRRGAVAAPGLLSKEELAVLAEQYAHESDDDLRGW